MDHDRDDPSKKQSAELRCSACRARGHDVEDCATATTGLPILIEKATRICEGRQYLLAEMIGVSESGLSRSLRASKLSPELRARVVALVVAGRLPDALPPARVPGRRPDASGEARSAIAYFATAADEKEFQRRADEHHSSRFGVLMDAIRAYRATHRIPPERLDAAPPWKLRCKIAKRDAVLHDELLDFDAWIGGAERRPLVLPTVLGEYLAVEVFKRRSRVKRA